MKKRGASTATWIIVVLIAAALIGWYFYSSSYTVQQPASSEGVKETEVSAPAPAAEEETARAPQETPEEAAPEKQAAKVDIIIKNFAFGPKTINVKVGTNVSWTNQDSAGHTITSDKGNELNSNVISSQALYPQSYSHVFNTPGTYAYHCTLHSYMKGTVIVE